MNIHNPKAPQALPQSVTTGPIAGSRKVYAAPAGRPDIRVPFREIALTDPNEAPVRVYDPSGPYTETDAGIDLQPGLPLVREAWIATRGFAAIAAARRQARGQRQRLGRDSWCPPARPSASSARGAARPDSSRSTNSPAPASSPRR